MHELSRSRLAAAVAGGMLLALLVGVVFALSWAGQRSRELSVERSAEAAAWDMALTRTAWLASIGLKPSEPQAPCSTEDDLAGRVQWVGDVPDWTPTSASIRERLTNDGWVDGQDAGDGYAVMVRQIGDRQVSLGLAISEQRWDNVLAVLHLSPRACGLL